MSNDSMGIRKSTQRPVVRAFIGFFLMLVLAMAYNAVTGRGVISLFQIQFREGRLYGGLIDILNRGSELAIVALGVTLAAACSGGADISVGAVMSLSGCLCCVLLAGFGVTHVRSTEGLQMPVFVGVLAGILAAGLCGAFNGFLVGKLKVHPILATLLLFTGGRAIGQMLINNKMVYILLDEFKVFGGYLGAVPTPIIITAACVLLIAGIARFTPLGKRVASTGESPKGARSAAVILACFVLCGLLAGVAGIIATSRIYASDANTIGLNMELDAILAVLLGGNSLRGGKFSLMGSVIGAYTVRTLTIQLAMMSVYTTQTTVIKGALAIILLVIQSRALQTFLADRRARKDGAPAAAERS